MGARSCLLVALAGGALVLPACGDEGGGESASATDAAPPAEIDGQCNAAQPYHVKTTGDTAEFYRLCVSEDQLSAEVRNTSALVLSVRARGAPAPVLLPGQPVALTPNDAVVTKAVPTECTGNGRCHVSPNGFLIAEGTIPVRLDVDVDPEQSAAASAASAIAGYATSKLQSRAQRLGGAITRCADSVGHSVKREQTFEELLRHVFESATLCPSAYSTIKREAGENPVRSVRSVTVGRKVLAKARPVLELDLFRYEVTHLISRFVHR
jgi:hypothetical protein